MKWTVSPSFTSRLDTAVPFSSVMDSDPVSWRLTVWPAAALAAADALGDAGARLGAGRCGSAAGHGGRPGDAAAPLATGVARGCRSTAGARRWHGHATGHRGREARAWGPGVGVGMHRGDGPGGHGRAAAAGGQQQQAAMLTTRIRVEGVFMTQIVQPRRGTYRPSSVTQWASPTHGAPDRPGRRRSRRGSGCRRPSCGAPCARGHGPSAR